MAISTFPSQKKSDGAKTKAWREDCVRWLSEYSVLDSSPVRMSSVRMRINYDLIAGVLDMDDLAVILNPTDAVEVADGKIQHYSIINKKLQVLQGEESDFPFDHRLVVTNKNAISEMEMRKKEEMRRRFDALMTDTAMGDDELDESIERLKVYFDYEYQDMREIRANCLVDHYWKEYNMPNMFNKGILDVFIAGEEIYQCYISNGKPCVRKLDPKTVHVLKSGYSNKIEDADMVIIEEFWAPGKIIDEFHDMLTPAQVEKIENYNAENGGAGRYGDERDEFVFNRDISKLADMEFRVVDGEKFIQFPDGITASALPYDLNGNIRVMQVFWKSLRCIKKVTSYDEKTGEEKVDWYPEDHIIDKNKGEEEAKRWVNEAWQGVAIGTGDEMIIVNARPCEVQYNEIGNPSKCHFGIIGNIYNINDASPHTLVDIMKPYSYIYDVTFDRLNKAMARNLGKLAVLDWSKKPEDMTAEYWVNFAKRNGVAIINNFNVGQEGKATGQLAGMYQHTPVMDADNSAYIKSLMESLMFIEQSLNSITGITPQREGQVSNRETKGGVEHAINQSSYITKWIFLEHNDVKKRVVEAFVDMAKVAMRGRSEEFQYIMPDNSRMLVQIDGDTFRECNYGCVVDLTSDREKLEQQFGIFAQAAMQNDKMNLSSLMEFYSSSSLAEKRRIIERDERLKEQQLQAQQQEANNLKEQEIQAQQQVEQMKMQMEEQRNIRDNETRILVAQIQAGVSEMQGENGIDSEKVSFQKDREKLEEKKYEFDKTHALKAEKLELDRQKLEVQRNKTSGK